jgi:hypothetical protein
MRRTLIFWTVAFAVLIAAFAATVFFLNATVYSASGFTRSYLDALARHDSAAALEIPGVRTANDADTALLADDAMGDLSEIALVSDTTDRSGEHTMVFDYTLGASDAGRTEFLVERTGTSFGLFSRWRFVASPLTTMSVTVLNDRSFDVNSLTVSSSRGADEPGSFMVFSPGRYTLGHTSTFLSASPVIVKSTTIGAIVDATIDVQANAEFVAKVQLDLNEFLDRCTTQTVLMPTSCPFGLHVNNRVDSPPKWSMSAYPVATIEPAENSTNDAGSWIVPNTEGVAHLNVTVRSLFDGSVSDLDRDVPFTVGYRVDIRSGTTIVLTPRAN